MDEAPCLAYLRVMSRFCALSLVSLSVWVNGCKAPQGATPLVSTWGTIREVLRDGRSEPRVGLAGLGRNGAVGVGALAGLGGEVTIVGGRVLVARADGSDCLVTEASSGAAATLLVHAEVERWQERPLPDCETYEQLDAAIAGQLARCGFDRRQPTPVRIRGHAEHVEYHVVAGACPIANPSGPAPWRFSGPIAEVELVGIYVEGAAGRWTHHLHDSHLHVVAPGRMGHLDAVTLTDAGLLLPARPR